MTSKSAFVVPATAWVALAVLLGCASRLVEPVSQAPVASLAVAPRRPLTLSILSTNDLHGRIAALPRIGGFINNLRRARAADGGGLLLLDAGDAFQGELASNLNEGEAVVDAYNVLGYTAAAVGNHEFDFGPVGPHAAPASGEDPRGALLARAAQATYPVLTANLTDVATSKPFSAPNLVPSTIVTVAGVKVGLVGLLTLETTQSVLASVFAGLELDPLESSLEREANALRERGATVVIAIAHAGGDCKSAADPDDLSSCDANAEIFRVARAVPPGFVDAIVAGHTHKRLAHRVNGIPIIEAGEHGEALARVDLHVDPETGRVTGHQLYVPVEVCTKAQAADACAPTLYEDFAVEEAPAVANVVARALQKAERRRNQALGVTASSPLTRGVGVESALSNLVADSMRRARPKADVTLMHTGGLRADLPAGPVRYGDFYDVYPRDSTFATATLTGAQLTAALEANLTGPGGLAVVAISGARVRGRCENGHLSVTLRRDDGRIIKPTHSLVVATNTLLATGAKGPLGGQPWQVEDEPPIREELVRVLTERGGSLAADDKTLFNPASPRIALPQPAPVRCDASTTNDAKPHASAR